MEKNVDLAQLVAQAQLKELENVREGNQATPDETNATGMYSIKDDDFTYGANGEKIPLNSETYKGPGIVLENKNEPPKRPPAANDINPDSLEKMLNI